MPREKRQDRFGLAITRAYATNFVHRTAKTRDENYADTSRTHLLSAFWENRGKKKTQLNFRSSAAVQFAPVNNRLKVRCEENFTLTPVAAGGDPLKEPEPRPEERNTRRVVTQLLLARNRIAYYPPVGGDQRRAMDSTPPRPTSSLVGEISRKSERRPGWQSWLDPAVILETFGPERLGLQY